MFICGWSVETDLLFIKMSISYNSTIFLVFVLILQCIVNIVGDKTDILQKDHRCSKIKRVERLSYLYQSGPCVVSYKARCGWFSLDLCTFYKKQICDKNSNVTQYYYSTVKVCCDGFIEAPNGTCISKKSADPQWVIDKENDTAVVYVNIGDIPTTLEPKPQRGDQLVQADDEESSISPGALAGAGCAGLFLVIVVAFMIISIYKRRKRRPKKKESRERDGMTMLTTTTT